MRKFGKIIFVVLVLGVIGIVYYWISSQAPKSPDLSKEHLIQGADHIPMGTPHPEYNSNPPSSGWHYAEPARQGFYDEELPDEQIVHNLEVLTFLSLSTNYVSSGTKYLTKYRFRKLNSYFSKLN